MALVLVTEVGKRGRFAVVDDHRGKTGRGGPDGRTDTNGKGRGKVKVQRGRKRPVQGPGILLCGVI